jgi:hypothetical protein
MSKYEPIYHSCVAGLLTDGMVNIRGRKGCEFIADVDFTVGEGSRHAVRVTGQVLMFEANHYDIVAFALLRELFGLRFPQLIIVNYAGSLGAGHLGAPSIACRFVVSKRFTDRELRESDYYPLTPENFEFRYQLCLLIYFCKFVGCNFSLDKVRVMDGYPFFWRCPLIGYAKAQTVSPEEFLLLFGVEMATAGHIYYSPVQSAMAILEKQKISERNRIMVRSEIAYLGNNARFVPLLSESGLGVDHEKGSEPKIEEHLRVLGPYGELDDEERSLLASLSDSQLSGTGLVAINRDLKPSEMFEKVVKYFREVDFDKDRIRECLYIREGVGRGPRAKLRVFPLSGHNADIAAHLEEKHALLSGYFPFRIF